MHWEDTSYPTTGIEESSTLPSQALLGDMFYGTCLLSGTPKIPGHSFMYNQRKLTNSIKIKYLS